MFTTPGLTAVTNPAGLTVATDGLPLVHEPPAGVAPNVVFIPTHNEPGPVMTGIELTDTV